MTSVPFTDPPGISAQTRRRGPEQPFQRPYAGSALQQVLLRHGGMATLSAEFLDICSSLVKSSAV
jgi:hypothetical protein